jgi:hypothetical protein
MIRKQIYLLLLSSYFVSLAVCWEEFDRVNTSINIFLKPNSFASTGKRGDPCTIDENCTEDLNACIMDDEKGYNVCDHKTVFPPKAMEILGLFTLALMMCLSTMGGIGGGGVVVPLLQTFFNF